MSADQVAAKHLRERARLAARAQLAARRAWAKVDPARISATWAAQTARLVATVAALQETAASSADAYVAEAAGDLAATEGAVNASALAGVASDGRSLVTLMQMPGITALQAIGSGHSVDRAMAAGGALAQLAASTQVSDAGRVADQVAMVARGHAGYIRAISGATCSRCIVLAGHWYRWNAGFNRHPHCDCIGVPVHEADSEDLITDPRKVFDGMTTAEQDKVFTKDGAQAIRDGADMGQVVNARRGMATAGTSSTRVNDAGRVVNVTRRTQVAAPTSEGITPAGFAGRRLREAPRLMPEQIYRITGDDRDAALRLLRRNGYVVDDVRRPAVRKTVMPPVVRV